MPSRQKMLPLVLMALSLTGCMAMIYGTAGRLNDIAIGMTKEEAIRKLGAPDSIAAHGKGEYLVYHWMEAVANTFNASSPSAWPQEYYVYIENGLVKAYGKKGDFDSTKLPTTPVNLQHDLTIREPSPPAAPPSPNKYEQLEQLFDLKTRGAITEEEYQEQKSRILGQ